MSEGKGTMSHITRKRWTVGASLVGLGAIVALVVSLGAGAGTTAVAVAPQNTSPPTITGTAQEGQKLVGSRGQWNNTPTDYNDFWVRCDTDGGSCANISGAHDRAGYTLKAIDVGNTIRFKVQAKNSSGTATASSAPTAVVKSAVTPPPADGCAKTGGTVPIAGIGSPARLNIDQSEVNPGTITFSTRSLTTRFHVTACKGNVEGALVYVTAVPYGMFVDAAEQPTGSDGWATVHFTALSGFPVSQKQQLLVMFVRARKSGEDLLGGISTRRLISFQVTR
jgi:hypothetical protein